MMNKATYLLCHLHLGPATRELGWTGLAHGQGARLRIDLSPERPQATRHIMGRRRALQQIVEYKIDPAKGDAWSYAWGSEGAVLHDSVVFEPIYWT